MANSTPELKDKEADIDRLYHERRDRFAAEAGRHRRRANLISHGRLAAFVGGLVGTGWGVFGGAGPQPLLVGIGLLALGGFAVLVVIHERVLRALRRTEALRDVNQVGICRLRREWSGIPEPKAGLSPSPQALDLDLLGHASLHHLLGTTVTPPGRATLARWLNSEGQPSSTEIHARQEAVTELAPLLDWRQELQAVGHVMAQAAPDPEPFLEWTEGSPWLLKRPHWIWGARLLAGVTVGLLIAQWIGVVSRPWWLALALVNLGVSAILARRIHEVFDRVSARESIYRFYSALFAQMVTQPFTSTRLREVVLALGGGEEGACRQMKRLDRLLGFIEVRRTGLIHLPLQALLLWDLQLLERLERWRLRGGGAARRWMVVLGEVEALAALAGLGHDHPSWVFPRFVEDRPWRLMAEGVGHPLLPPASCVTNDVTIGPEGTFLLVTGSNMSGKSTLLRAVGVNAVLARLGGPVFARTLELSPFLLGTSFRLRDSLEEGVSYFMAELRRLKAIVDDADRASEVGCVLLYLLDEILLGTNIIDRQVAVQRVLARLVSSGAIGAISTHDLTLASAEGLIEACRPVHFTETVLEEGETAGLHFDYRLRPGVATTRNALRLLEMVGIDRQGAPQSRPFVTTSRPAGSKVRETKSDV